MVSEPYSKRPMCPSCSKPSRVCLCSRIKTPSLNNSVGVTILQHSLEHNHPLNSTRIATLGLKNLNLVSVSDVNIEARFEIRSLESYSDLGSYGSKVNCTGSREKSQTANGFSLTGAPIIFTILKSGVISSCTDHLMTQSECQNPNFDLLLASPEVLDYLSKGFVVKKWQMNGSFENEEFGIRVPPGSALLFPNERSVGFEAIDFEVKNLIVLDGTWAKAKRVYSENPWLKLLPHLKLDLDKMSLYGEVRQQPRAGCLSTIESIVYALKAVGDESDGLDNLLEVFESMVGDQRRCMAERLSKISLA